MLKVENLHVSKDGRSILKGLEFIVGPNELVGLVGRSGSGKSTFLKACLGLLTDAAGFSVSGKIRWKENLLPDPNSVLPVFQDPFGSFSPFGTMEELLREPFRIKDGIFPNKRQKELQQEKINSLCEEMFLSKTLLTKNRSELSGGQLQRFAILRALLANPEFLILDEPVTALDVIVQSKIADLLVKIQREKGIGMLVISHDLGFLSAICSRLIVLDSGTIVEQGKTSDLKLNPQSSLLKTLWSSRFHSFVGTSTSSESSN